jgi:hypothetical protein
MRPRRSPVPSIMEFLTALPPLAAWVPVTDSPVTRPARFGLAGCPGWAGGFLPSLAFPESLLGMRGPGMKRDRVVLDEERIAASEMQMRCAYRG